MRLNCLQPLLVARDAPGHGCRLAAGSETLRAAWEGCCVAGLIARTVPTGARCGPRWSVGAKALWWDECCSARAQCRRGEAGHSSLTNSVILPHITN